MQKINYNAAVKVLLDKEGIEIYIKRYGENPPLDNNGVPYVEDSLWMIMSIFGPYMRAGVSFFADGCIHIYKEDLKEI